MSAQDEKPNNERTENSGERDPLARAPGWGAIGVAALIGLAMLAAGVIFAEPLRAGYERARSALFNAEHEGHEGHAAEGEGGETSSYYTCGMHPWVVLPEPGTCPVCQMDLTPLDPEKFTGEIAIDPIVVQNMGVRVKRVEAGPVTRTIRTVGTVRYDETRVRDVNLKVDGWIEKLHVDYVGASVDQGEPLFELYSPQLYEAQQDYLLALRNGGGDGEPSTSPEHSAPGADVGRSLLESARTRLEYLDVTDEQIERLRQRGSPSKTMTIRSPHAGTVIDKHANEGMKIDPGMRVYRVADLSEVWVMVTLYEQQLPYVEEGQRAEMRLSYLPGRTYEGEVLQVYPFMEDGTRQARVRLAFENPDGKLKPGMYAHVELKSELAERAPLAPNSAVIDTGKRQIAFVSLGDGKFEPRELTLGAKTDDDRVQVLEGLEPGEPVVTSGQFLLDSEARTREALAKMIRGNPASEQEAEAPPAEGNAELSALPAPATEALTAMLKAYFRIGEALASDRAAGLSEPAQRIAGSIEALRRVELKDRPHFWHERMETMNAIRDRAQELSSADTLQDARPIYAGLSEALTKLVEATGVPPQAGDPVQRLHCPMYPEDGERGSVWLQRGDEVRNPFFGSEMLGCFDERTTPPTTSGTGTGEAGGDAAPSGPSMNGDSEGSGDHTDHGMDDAPASEPRADAVPAAIQAAVDETTGAYLAMTEALSGDDVAAARQQLRALREAVEAASGDTEAYQRFLAPIATEAEQVAAAENAEAFREAFKKLSAKVIELTRAVPPAESAGGTLYRIHCPMVKADWLQRSEQVANPYDTSMLRCGSVQAELTPREAASGDAMNEAPRGDEQRDAER